MRQLLDRETSYAGHKPGTRTFARMVSDDPLLVEVFLEFAKLETPSAAAFGAASISTHFSRKASLLLEECLFLYMRTPRTASFA